MDPTVATIVSRLQRVTQIMLTDPKTTTRYNLHQRLEEQALLLERLKLALEDPQKPD
jgi:hypothetical protein